MAIISFANQKGGVGKTTSTFNLGAALVKQGNRVLLVDNDPQGNLTSYALTSQGTPQTTVDDFYLTRRKPVAHAELVEISPGFSILAADPGSSGADYYLMQRPMGEVVLKAALSSVASDFDYVLIDNPPALNLLTVNGLLASDGIIVPVSLEFFSLEGIVLLNRTIHSLQTKSPGLKLLGILPNMFNDRRRLNCQVLEALQKEFSNLVFKTIIHDSVKLAESSGHGQSILEYAASSRTSKEFLELAKEVSARCEGKNETAKSQALNV